MKKQNDAQQGNNYSKLTFKQFFNKIILKIRKLSKVRIIFLVHLFVILLSSLILFSPLAQTGDVNVSYTDAIFTTASAFSDTGLVTVDTYKTWNAFGQALIAILILAGGIGIFVLKVFFISLILPNSKNSISEMGIVSHERGSDDFGTTKKIIFNSVGFLLITTFISSIFLTLYFYLSSPLPAGDEFLHGDFVSPKSDFALSLRYGFFHSISALNNAGFDIIGKKSLLSYYNNVGLQVYFSFLFVLGGLGYPVIYDILSFIRFRIIHKGPYKKRYVFKLITKLSLLTYLITTFFGFIFILLFELMARNSLAGDSFWDRSEYGSSPLKIWHLFFLSISTRSAGFSTVDLGHISTGSIATMTILMFIGAGPVSTGGGIRTTTIAILIMSIIARIKGQDSVRAFRRRVDEKTVKMSSIIFTTSTLLVVLFSLICTTSLDRYGGELDANKYDFSHIIFEVSSAFGTCGLTTGATSHFNLVSKIFLIIIMFVGQFGISSTVLVWGNKINNSRKIDYIHEEVMIG